MKYRYIHLLRRKLAETTEALLNVHVNAPGSKTAETLQADAEHAARALELAVSL